MNTLTSGNENFFSDLYKKYFSFVLDKANSYWRSKHLGEQFYYVTLHMTSVVDKTIRVKTASVWEITEKAHKVISPIKELQNKEWKIKDYNHLEKVFKEIENTCMRSKLIKKSDEVKGQNLVQIGGDAKKILYQFKKRFEKEGKESFMNTNKYFLDKGLELFGFGEPNDKELKVSDVFGRIVYYKDLHMWYAPEYITLPPTYTTYNNKNQWLNTYINHPYRNYEGLAYSLKLALNDPKKLYQIVQIFGECINIVNERDNSLGATCDPKMIADGKDKRFFIVWIDFSPDKYIGNCAFFLAYFNKKQIWFVIDSKFKFYAFTTGRVWSDSVKNTADINSIKNVDLSKVSAFKQFALEDINTTTVTPEVIDTTQEIITQDDPYVDGNYDQEDTNVTVNATDDNAADVDIRVDLTPDREQQLLQMYVYDMYTEQDYYGNEAFTYKVNRNSTVISKLFNDIYNSINTKSKSLLNKNIDFTKLAVLTTDINNKENFITTLEGSSKKISNLSKIIRKLAEEDIDDRSIEDTKEDISDKNVKEMYLKLINSKSVKLRDSHFDSKEDIYYLVNCLNNNKASVNVSQIQYYMNKLVDKISKDNHDYAVETYDYISNILSDMHMSLLQNASLLSKGNRLLAMLEANVNNTQNNFTTEESDDFTDGDQVEQQSK